MHASVLSLHFFSKDHLEPCYVRTRVSTTAGLFVSREQEQLRAQIVKRKIASAQQGKMSKPINYISSLVAYGPLRSYQYRITGSYIV